MKEMEILKPFTDITVDNYEKILDELIENPILKEVPVIKNIIAIFKTGKNFREYFFLKKIESFLFELNNMPQEKIEHFKDNIKNDTNLGLKIIQFLERFDEVEKASLIGKLFILFLNKKIESAFYIRLCHLIDKCFYNDIEYLKKFKTNERITSNNECGIKKEILESLFSNGVLGNFGYDGGNFAGKNSGTIYGLNEYSSVILEVL